MTQQSAIARAIVEKLTPAAAASQRAVERIRAIVDHAIARADKFGERMVYLARDEAKEIRDALNVLKPDEPISSARDAAAELSRVELL